MNKEIRREKWITERDRLYAAIEEDLVAIENDNDHPLNLELCDHYDNLPWRDRLFVFMLEQRESFDRAKETGRENS